MDVIKFNFIISIFGAHWFARLRFGEAERRQTKGRVGIGNVGMIYGDGNLIFIGEIKHERKEGGRGEGRHGSASWKCRKSRDKPRE